MTSLKALLDVPVSTHTARVREWAADFLIVPVFEGDDLADLVEVEDATGGDIARSLASREFRAKLFDTYVTKLDGHTTRALCIGGGPRERLTAERVRKMATAAGWAARQRGGSRVAWWIRPSMSLDQARPTAEGLLLAMLAGDRYKTSTRDAATLTEIALLTGDPGAVTSMASRGALDAYCTNIARWLSDEPGNQLGPGRLAEHASAVLDGTGVVVEVLDEPRLTELGMGLILGVGKGSSEPPRVIVMRHRPDIAPQDHVLALVGKGVTFDSGGISIKPAESMDKMKHDMSGGAAVIAAMRGIAELKLPLHVIGIVPAVENMPGGKAFKPGDILTSAAGKTVEVLNTDAEGRLILGDALWFARQQGATHIVDVATLTGAVVIALGKVCSGLFGRPDAWVDTVQGAAAAAGERYWRLPADDDYAELLRSEYADMTNTGGRAGGAIAGAMFLREYVGDAAWVHLDVAGTAWADDAKPWQPKGATGVTVRTLIELAAQMARR